MIDYLLAHFIPWGVLIMAAVMIAGWMIAHRREVEAGEISVILLLMGLFSICSALGLFSIPCRP